MNYIITALLVSFSSPLILLFLEKILPSFYLGLEELVKLGVVWFIVRGEKLTNKRLFNYLILGGFLFTLSEASFYLVNILSLGKISLFFQRLILTGTLHIGTILLLYWFLKKGFFWAILGFGGAILIHYFYNFLLRLVWV